MRKEKVKYKDFIRSISSATGFTQKDIITVMDAAADVVLNNLKNGVETTVFQGMVVYPATYKDKTIFPRARFGKFFKNFAPAL